MTTPGRGPAVPDGTSTWSRALLRGFLVFLLILGIGVLASAITFALAGPSVSFEGALRIGALYLGPFHHVAVVVEGDVSFDGSALPGVDLPSGGSATVAIGVALLAVTGLAAWLLFRAGRVSAFGDRASVRALTGSRVAFGYAPAVALVALVVRFEEPVELGSFVTGGVRISLSVWQAIVFPFAIAAFAGASGGAWSWVSSARDRASAIRAGAVLGGGWRMFLLAIALSYVGLFVAGIVQPDEPVALATPSTARYVSTVFDRPRQGAIVLAHHVALWPNEALWAFVPAAGGCDVVRGSERSDFLCYRRFPDVTSTGEVAFATAPAGYLAFLLVPAIASLAGGRWAGSASERTGSRAAAIGAASGVVFAIMVFAGCLLSSITLSYGTSAEAIGPDGGHLWIGPDPVAGTLVALAWGVLGGALGAASAGFRSRRGARTPGR